MCELLFTYILSSLQFDYNYSNVLIVYANTSNLFGNLVIRDVYTVRITYEPICADRNNWTHIVALYTCDVDVNESNYWRRCWGFIRINMHEAHFNNHKYKWFRYCFKCSVTCNFSFLSYLVLHALLSLKLKSSNLTQKMLIIICL